MSNEYSEGDKMLLASLLLMEVFAMQSENDIRKFHGNNMKYDERDFMVAERDANRRLRDYRWIFQP